MLAVGHAPRTRPCAEILVRSLRAASLPSRCCCQAILPSLRLIAITMNRCDAAARSRARRAMPPIAAPAPPSGRRHDHPRRPAMRRHGPALDLPAHVLRLAPLGRRLCGRRDAGVLRPAPLGPECCRPAGSADTPRALHCRQHGEQGETDQSICARARLLRALYAAAEHCVSWLAALAFAHDLQHLLDHVVDRQARRLDRTASAACASGEPARVESLRSRSASAVATSVTAAIAAPGVRRIVRTAPGALLGRRVEVDLHVGVGNTTVPMSRPSMTTPPGAPISRCRATSTARTRGMPRDGGRGPVDLRRADRLRHVMAIDPTTPPLDGRAGPRSPSARRPASSWRSTPLVQRLPGHRAVHGAGVHVAVLEACARRPAPRSLPGTRRPIDGDDQRIERSLASYQTSRRIHPRARLTSRAGSG